MLVGRPTYDHDDPVRVQPGPAKLDHYLFGQLAKTAGVGLVWEDGVWCVGRESNVQRLLAYCPVGLSPRHSHAVAAAEMAVSSPLLEESIDGAHGVLLSIAGGSDLGLFEVSAAANLIEAAAHDEANIIFGTIIDDGLGDEVRVTVIAAGFDGGAPPRRQPGVSSRPGLNVNGTRNTPLTPSNAQNTPTASQVARGPQVTGQTPQQAAPQQQAPMYQAQPTTNPNQGFESARTPRPAPADDDLDIPDFLK